MDVRVISIRNARFAVEDVAVVADLTDSWIFIAEDIVTTTIKSIA